VELAGVAVLLLLVLLVVMMLMGLVVQGVMEQPLVYLVHLSHTLVEAVVVDIMHLLQQAALVVEEQDQEMIQLQQQEQLIVAVEAAVEAVYPQVD
tara:strand:+ start:535 stop:819 length:285 start_codon:yes stop_codon:yes gene_type:complete